MPSTAAASASPACALRLRLSWVSMDADNLTRYLFAIVIAAGMVCLLRAIGAVAPAAEVAPAASRCDVGYSLEAAWQDTRALLSFALGAYCCRTFESSQEEQEDRTDSGRNSASRSSAADNHAARSAFKLLMPCL
eukprot:TRINITY_DN8500_c0_g1_i1.p1 TRINITY_DN8500_c0_g1~~TRINITY_DN8500_c0_g1_i1.p1  ORF type:complete len:135 (+),score=23.00 TRINITY_DN8500_c0_g1_i1:74-478(+)